MTPDDGGRWGILGGTFDPVHRGHLNLARQVANNRSLDGVLLIPSYRHPFKDDFHTTFDNRIKMLELASAEYSDFIVCSIEKDMDLSGFTVDSIIAIKTRYPKPDFYFIIGEDNVQDLQLWRSPERILSEVRMLVGQRPPHESGDMIKQFPPDRIEMVAINMLDVSSTQIREMLVADTPKDSFGELMPDAVVEYIFENGLYQ